MATSERIKARIAEMARQLAEEFGEVDENAGTCWLDAIENQSIEIGDAMSTLLAERLSSKQAADDAAICQECGTAGTFRGQRERELIGRRGPIRIQEPEYYCACCRKSFFPDDASHRRGT